MLSSRLKAFATPISQTTAIASPITSLWTSWTWVPVARTIAAAPPCAASLARGESPNRSSVETGHEHERDSRVHAREGLVRMVGADGGSDPQAGGEPDEDPDPAEARGRRVVPALR